MTIDFSKYKRKTQETKEDVESPLPVDFSKYKREVEEEPERKTSVKSGAKAFHRGATSAILSAPRAVTGLLKYGSEALTKKGKELAEREGREISPEEEKFTNVVNKIFSYPEKLLEKLGLPTHEEAREFVARRMETPQEELESPTGIERGLETGGSFLGAAASTPIGSFGGLSRSALTGLGAAGAGVASGLGGEEGAQLGGAVALPAIVQLASDIRTGKLRPTGVRTKKLYQELKSMGLSDAEITPIIQTPLKQKVLGHLAKDIGRGKKAIEESKGALGSLYEKAKDKGTKLGKASAEEEKKLMIKLNALSSELRKSKMPPESKSQVIGKIEDMVGDIFQNGIGADDIIATWQDINQTVDWRSFRTGKKNLQEVKDMMSDTLQSISPELNLEFKKLNNAWGKLQKTSDAINKKKSMLISMGEAGQMLHAITDLISSGNINALGGVASVQGAKVLASEMLTNPRLNNILNKLLIASSKGTKTAVNDSVKKFSEELRKENPDLYKEFDFSFLR